MLDTGSANNTIGGTAGAGNTIGGNVNAGVEIADSGTTGNVVLGNLIGTNASGDNLGNAIGVSISAPSNTIGGPATGTGNVISGNTGDGITISSTGTLVEGNKIGTDITGSLAHGNGASGISISGSSNTIGGPGTAGNVISGNVGDGITIAGNTANPATNNVVEGNKIGTDVTGQQALGNTLAGIRVQTGSNTIGGPGNGAGNVISANQSEGLFITGDGNLVQGNLIGTNSLGTESLGNGLSGVTLQNSASNLIVANVLSGNGTSTAGGLGITIAGANAQYNLVQGNLIGTDFQGSTAFPNSGGGVLLFAGAANNTIGGTSQVAGNVISGNTFEGIVAQNAPDNSILGNKIGTNAAGTAGLGNGATGISLEQSSGTSIIGNLISDNGTKGIAGDGIRMTGPGADDNLVQANRIGTDKTGTFEIGNHEDGVFLESGAANNTIGGTSHGAGNLISGNQGQGIEISGSDSTGNVIAGNIVGLNVAGSATLGNLFDAILITDASNTIVGPSNVLSGNGTNGEQGVGLEIEGATAQHNRVFQNLIGTNAKGNQALGNSYTHGVFLGDGVHDNIIGPSNAISGNGSPATQGVGVYLYGSSNTRNQVVGNEIGTNVNGSAALNNSVIGVLIFQSNGDTVQGNLISGNQFVGVEIAGATASGNQLLGNLIGTDASATRPIPNGLDGVFLNNAPKNTIGGSISGAGNLISANGSVGIQLFGPQTAGNVIQGNLLGLNSAGRPTLPNPAGGIYVNTRPLANQIGGTAPGQANQGQVVPVYSISGALQSQASPGTSPQTTLKRRLRFPKRFSQTAALIGPKQGASGAHSVPADRQRGH